MGLCESWAGLGMGGGPTYQGVAASPWHVFYRADFELLHVDEFVDELLHSDRVCDIILPRLQVGGEG